MPLFTNLVKGFSVFKLLGLSTLLLTPMISLADGGDVPPPPLPGSFAERVGGFSLRCEGKFQTTGEKATFVFWEVVSRNQVGAVGTGGVGLGRIRGDVNLHFSTQTKRNQFRVEPNDSIVVESSLPGSALIARVYGISFEDASTPPNSNTTFGLKQRYNGRLFSGQVNYTSAGFTDTADLSCTYSPRSWSVGDTMPPGLG